MRNRNELLIAGAAAMLWAALSVATPALAQAPSADLARKALTKAANALGMVRGVNRALDIVNMFEYTASGIIADPTGGAAITVSRITAGYDYVIPAARIDIAKTATDGNTVRDITVAAGGLTWDESSPGIYLRPASTPAAERLRPIWLLPHGVILAGAKAPDKVKVANKGDGVTELSVALADGTEVKALLDAKNLATHVEVKVGAQVLSADYAEYKDFQDYGVMFPSRIVQKVDGRIAADLTVTQALANPYLIFPLPKDLVGK